MPTSITTAPGFTNSRVDEARATDGGDEDVRAGAHRAQVAGARVADGDRGVGLQQKLRHRLAEQVGAPHHHRFGAFEIRASTLASSSITPEGVQGRRPGRPSESKPAFTGVRPSTSLPGSISEVSEGPSRWEGSGSCNSTPSTSESSLRVVSRSATSSKRGTRRKADIERPHPHLHARALLAAHVHAGGGVLADEHGRETGGRVRLAL